MKDRLDAILHAAQARYLDALLPPREPLLVEMEAHAAREGIPISDPEVGRLLAILAAATAPRRILEIGTAIGYGVIWLARGAPEARITTIDRDPAQLAAARRYVARAGVLDRVELVEGEAVEVLRRLEGPFDLAYVDAAKRQYRRYLDLLLPLLRPGGLVALDNLLWKGRVAAPAGTAEDEEAAALRDFNRAFARHPGLEALVLPLGDGLGLAVKARGTASE